MYFPDSRIIKLLPTLSLILISLSVLPSCKFGQGFFESAVSDSPSTVTPTPTPVDPAIVAKMTAIVESQNATTHEATIPDVRFQWHERPGVISQSPSGLDIPDWFEHPRPEWCTILNTWMQVFEADGNTATNTRVQYRNLKLYVLSERTKTWTQLQNDVAPRSDTWEYPFTFNSSGGTRNEDSQGGGYSFKPDYPLFSHGYGTHNVIEPQDVRAVFATMETRLVLEDPMGTDDRSQAKYLVNVGADYWPDADAVNRTWPYAPGVGQGRFILATEEWRQATMIVPNTRYGSSMDEMINTYPPPLD